MKYGQMWMELKKEIVVREHKNKSMNSRTYSDMSQNWFNVKIDELMQLKSLMKEIEEKYK